MCRWSDGTVSLMIGKECVDLKDEPIAGQRLLLGVRHCATGTVQVWRRSACYPVGNVSYLVHSWVRK